MTKTKFNKMVNKVHGNRATLKEVLDFLNEDDPESIVSIGADIGAGYFYIGTVKGFYEYDNDSLEASAKKLAISRCESAKKAYKCMFHRLPKLVKEDPKHISIVPTCCVNAAEEYRKMAVLCDQYKDAYEWATKYKKISDRKAVDFRKRDGEVGYAIILEGTGIPGRTYWFLKEVGSNREIGEDDD